MKNLQQYLEKIEFDFAITYSGLRGELLDLVRKEIKEKKKEIENEIKTVAFKEKTRLKEKLSELQGTTNLYNSRTINKDGELHLTSKKISNLSAGNDSLTKIIQILTEDCNEPYFLRCPPVYRDSIVFYNNEQSIKGIIHFCFECFSIIDENNNEFGTNRQILSSLKDILIKLGHPIEP
jgi:hypothetical protein